MHALEQIKRLSPERFLALYESLQQQGFGPLDGELAKQLRFRPQAMRKLPMAQRARRAKMLIESAHNVEMAYELLGAYLIRHHKDLVTQFLDATGVPHEEGMIEDLDAGRPDPEKILPAIRALDEKHDPGDVTLYLALCAQQWPELPQLAEAWGQRAG